MTARPSTPRVLFLGGLGRSGTTLLERLLGELPGVVPLGEVVHLWERGVLAGEPCGCGALFDRCPFWSWVGERAFGGWSAALAQRVLELRERVDRTRRIARISHPDLAEYVSAYRSIYHSVTGARVVIDSSKHASLAHCLAAGGLDVDFVQVVRDPRAVAHSWRRSVARPEDGGLMTRWGSARTSLHWTAQNLALDLLSRRGARVTRVRYEDLMADPRSTLTSLATEVLGLNGPLIPAPLDPPDSGEPVGAGLDSLESGVDSREAGLDLGFLDGTTARLTAAHTVSGNPMRFTVGSIELARDDSWRTGLPRRHRGLVAGLTWPLRSMYGYRKEAA